MSVRVLLVDDQPLIRAGLRGILETAAEIIIVGEASDGEEAVRLACDLRPDVTCMDVQMPGLDGLGATERIVAEGVPTAVLILTTFDDDEYLFGALRVGASGFVVKTAPPEALIEAVKTLAAGDALLSPAVTRRVLERFHSAGKLVSPAPSAVAELTARERDVVELVAAGLSNVEIAVALTVSATTVKTHVSHVLAKLGLRDRVQLVVYAFRHGIVAIEP